ncbi:MAG TPA: ABC transporter ATP-binding protein [Candidatus Sulfotelmatobacter sp.]|nr:ABC transporter ATP-binding protein [Candidatus Sulfotelmatobacter sp.]
MTLLQTSDLVAHYGDFQALFGIDFHIAQGEAVALIGANGAGKTTFLRTITGLLPAAPEHIRFHGVPIGSLAADRIVKLGIAMVPEGRKLFRSLTVEENLQMGAQRGRPGPWTLARVFSLFPVLAERRRAPASTLSGGQQQMVAIGRALMANPELLLCDEISLGLAPLVIRDIYAALPDVRGDGTTLLIVEQDIGRALAVADRVYCLQEGRVSLQGRPQDLTREQIRLAYFGV